mgnify:CR=1 FL=1
MKNVFDTLEERGYIEQVTHEGLKDWFENPGDMTASDIAVFASTLIYGGVRGVIDAGDKIEGSGK